MYVHAADIASAYMDLAANTVMTAVQYSQQVQQVEGLLAFCIFVNHVLDLLLNILWLFSCSSIRKGRCQDNELKKID